jgi:hypothetical protein
VGLQYSVAPVHQSVQAMGLKPAERHASDGAGRTRLAADITECSTRYAHGLRREGYDDVKPKSRIQNPDAEPPKFAVLHICLSRNVCKTVRQIVEA